MSDFNQLLRLAIKARQTVHASLDPTESHEYNLLILRWYAGTTMGVKDTPATDYFYSQVGDEDDEESIEQKMSMEGALIYTTEERPPQIPHVGKLIPPRNMINWQLRKYTGQPARYIDLLRGFSLADIDYTMQMASAMSGSITQANVSKLLDIMEIGSGLDKVQVLPEYYVPHPEVVKVTDKAMAVRGNDTLAISGIMFEGESGTGKTSAATYIASSLALPAYRLDLTTTLGKYYGQSEYALRGALAKIDAASPCVVLFDEVEKVLGGVDDALVRRLVSTLLWWLENKPSGVLAVMTCNDSTTIPYELYRPGRIDERIEIKPDLKHNKSVAAAFGAYMTTLGHVNQWKKIKPDSLKGTPTAIIGEIKDWYRENEPTSG